MTALPRGWAEAAVEELGEWRGGGTPSKARDSFWRNGTVPWVSPKDMKRNFIDDADDHITEHAVRDSATNLIPPQSVLVVTRSGILRHSLPIAINTREVAINQDLKALTPHDGVDAEFVAGQFRADARRFSPTAPRLGRRSTASTSPGLKSADFDSHPSRNNGESWRSSINCSRTPHAPAQISTVSRPSWLGSKKPFSQPHSPASSLASGGSGLHLRAHWIALRLYEVTVWRPS